MKCKTFIEKAIDIDKENPEGYQLMASFMLSKDDKEVCSVSISFKSHLSNLLPLTDMLQMERSGDTTLRVTLE
jgi:hypothetical protein